MGKVKQGWFDKERLETEEVRGNERLNQNMENGIIVALILLAMKGLCENERGSQKDAEQYKACNLPQKNR